MPDALSDAKAALAHANKAFPTKAVATTPAPKASAVTPAKAARGGLGVELAEKGKMMNNARKALGDLPKMHKGGPVTVDGAYHLKAGEHVLTAKEAGRARAHALMAGGMRSLAKPAAAPTKRGTASMTVEPMPKTSFADKNLDPKAAPGGSAQRISSDNAKPAGSISPMKNAPRQLKTTQGTTKTSDLSRA